jgi:hypothetical protein
VALPLSAVAAATRGKTPKNQHPTPNIERQS